MDGPKSLVDHFSGIADPRVDRRKLHAGCDPKYLENVMQSVGIDKAEI